MRNSLVAHVIRNPTVARQGGTDMQVEREIIFPASPTEVWEALTEPERLEEWFATEVELDARPGGEGGFRWGDGDERRGRGGGRPGGRRRGAGGGRRRARARGAPRARLGGRRTGRDRARGGRRRHAA